MEQRRNFGRRVVSQPPAAPAVMCIPAEPSPPPEAGLPSIDDEIAAWKAARRPAISFPWRQLSLMAGLSFGIASFVLPDTINDAVQWPLYVLTAVSFYAGLHRRKAKPD